MAFEMTPIPLFDALEHLESSFDIQIAQIKSRLPAILSGAAHTFTS